MTHTPGPWHIGMKPGPMIYGTKGEQVSDMHETLLDTTEHRANARLIAAAPDLLIALKEMMRQFEPDQADYDDGENYNPPDWLVLARDAIAKAEGKS